MPITSFILKSVHLFVMLVANHSDSRNILADTFPSTVWIVYSAVVCVNGLESLALVPKMKLR